MPAVKEISSGSVSVRQEKQKESGREKNRIAVATRTHQVLAAIGHIQKTQSEDRVVTTEQIFHYLEGRIDVRPTLLGRAVSKGTIWSALSDLQKKKLVMKILTQNGAVGYRLTDDGESKLTYLFEELESFLSDNQ